MTGQVQRLLPALLIALLLHGVLLSLQLRENRVMPAAKALQRITVSLGTKAVVKTQLSEKPAWLDQVGRPQQTMKIPYSGMGRPLLPRFSEKQLLQPSEEKKEVKSSKPVVGEYTAPAVSTATSRPVHIPKPSHRKMVSRQRQSKPKLQTTITSAAEQKRIRQPASSPSQEKEHGDPQPSSTAVVLHRATPLYQVNPPPEYPRLARRRGIEGVVIIKVLVDSSGRVADIRVSRSSGHALLDRAAMKGVQRWRFTPGTMNGRLEEMWVEVPVRFQLR